MKILQICPAFFPAISIGGPIFTSLSLQHVLEEKNHQVDVLATPLGMAEKDKGLIRYNSPMPISLKMKGVITYHRFYGYPHFTFAPQSFFWMLKNIDKYEIVIFNGIWNFPFLAAAIVCKIKGVPYFVFPHGTLYKETVQLSSFWIKKIFLKLFVRRMLEGAKRIIFTTNDEMERVNSFLKFNLTSFVMPNIVRAVEFDSLPAKGSFRKDYGIPSDAIVLLHYGRISKKKGIEFSIQALSKLSNIFPNLILVVVGGDEEGYRATIESYVNNFRLSDKVIFTGMVNSEFGKKALVDADVFVLPSLSENFGMAVVEAMLCNLPVIISDNVGISQDVSYADAGVVVKLSSGNEQLVNAITDILTNPTKRLALVAKGRQFAINNYDEKAVSNKIDQLLSLV